jgi:hypothetical protein
MQPDPPPAPPSALDAAQNAIAALSIPSNATEDELIRLWLHGKSPHIIRAYAEDVATFAHFTGKPLRAT